MLTLSTGEIVKPAFTGSRNRFTYNAKAVSAVTSIDFEGTRTRTQQNFKEETDINTIVRRFGLTGQLPDNVRSPQYVDFEGVFDFQSAMNAVLEAEASFMAFPAETRKFFDNDPQKMMQFVSDDKNRDKAIELGLVPKPVEASEPPPVRVHVVDPATKPSAPSPAP